MTWLETNVHGIDKWRDPERGLFKVGLTLWVPLHELGKLPPLKAESAQWTHGWMGEVLSWLQGTFCTRTTVVIPRFRNWGLCPGPQILRHPGLCHAGDGLLGKQEMARRQHPPLGSSAPPALKVWVWAVSPSRLVQHPPLELSLCLTPLHCPLRKSNPHRGSL